MSLPNPRQVCENILHEKIHYNIEHEVWPSENRVAERLLARGTELAEAYDEIYAKLHRRPLSLDQFLGMLLSFQAIWSPDKIALARSEREALEEANRKIEKKARSLAELLEQRSELNNTSGFSSGTIYHICDVIEQASVSNGLYQFHLRKELDRLSGQYDLKYWPALSKCLTALADDAAKAKSEATDPLTEAATTSKRSSTSDSVMGFLAYIEDCRGDYEGGLQRDFQVSDKTMATLMNVLLDLPADKLLTAEYVKGRRQRARGLAVQQENSY